MQVVIEGTVGSSYRGDIAIDDVNLNQGSCSSTTSDPLSCDFEDGVLCQYTQDTTDNFDWTRQQRNTASVGSGPTNDHTYGTAQGRSAFGVYTFTPAAPEEALSAKICAFILHLFILQRICCHFTFK
jgi:hypothetical protein